MISHRPANSRSRSPSSSRRRVPTTTLAPTSAQVSASGSTMSEITDRISVGLAASSSASMITLNRRPRRSVRVSRTAGAKSSTTAGRGAEAARAISVAISSALLALACTAQATDPAVAFTAWSSGGSCLRTVGSAVVTIRPSTADLPTPGSPVITSTRRSTPPRSSQSRIAVSAAVRPRKR